MNDIYIKYKDCTGVSIDTRKINHGEMFFAIKGERFDANDYIDVALEKGAKYIITDQKSTIEKYPNVILVEDVVLCLQDLTKLHREQLNIPFIGITGSNGKTTTKELIHAVLSQKYNTYATKGNLNNHLGVPLTILDIKEDCEIAIVEMGANHVGEIEFLCSMSKPTHGVITNIGKAHLEGFGGIDGVIKGKTELYKSLESRNGIIFYNNNSSILKKKLPANAEYISYGANLSVITNYPLLILKNEGIEYHSKLVGSYNAINISCALSIGKYFEVDDKLMKKAIEDYNSTMNRSQIIQKENFSVIADAYNANPISMKAAIENFIDIEHDHKVLIIGDMLELGDFSTEEHQKIVDSLEHFKGEVILVGKEFYNTITDYQKYKDINEISVSRIETLLQNSLVLIKGSRGIALEKLIDKFD